MAKAAILLLNGRGLETARRIQSALAGDAEVWGLKDRITDADRGFESLGETIQSLYRDGVTIIGLCATGILIRALAPMLADKRGEPPVLAVSDDGAVVIPLLGGLTGANELAKDLADALGATAAISASGSRAFRLQLEAPPEGYVLANAGDAKTVTSDLLAGGKARLIGTAPWLEASKIAFQDGGEIVLKVSAFDEAPPAGGLLFHPRAVAMVLEDTSDSVDVEGSLARHNLASRSLAAIVLPDGMDVPDGLADTARDLGAAIRIVPAGQSPTASLGGDVEHLGTETGISVFLSGAPLDVARIGRPMGHLSIIGLGPGDPQCLTGEALAALDAASDIVGYETYVNLVPASVGPKIRHISGNRVELERSREALDLAAQGRNVAVVSSGDPGIFAMAAAVMEAVEAEPGRWTGLTIGIVPGVSAMQVAASRLGAPLGHDFCAISLSDIRKPWDVIEQRLDAASKAGLVIALYNPASKTRRDQIETARDIVLRHRAPETPVILGHNLGRSGERTRIIPLGDLESAMVDMRTILIIGSSRSRTFRGPGGRQFAYAPRSHEDP